MPQENVRWMVELRLGIREEQAERLMDSSGIRSTLTQHSYRGAHQATQLSGPLQAACPRETSPTQSCCFSICTTGKRNNKQMHTLKGEVSATVDGQSKPTSKKKKKKVPLC